ncbi:unnamed protein product, partial [marine sediment metagenome]
GNIDIDPLFRDPENSDYHLMSTECGDPHDSPCIDTGHPDIIDNLLDCSWGLGTILSDMGAYGGGDSVQVGIDERIFQVPDRLTLLQNYPNPFNAVTILNYSLPRSSEITVSIYNLLGQRVATLFQGIQGGGKHTITWDATNFPSGVYFARLKFGELTQNVKMLLLR